MTATEGGALPTSSSDQATDVRLHVTPLDAELLKVIISSSILPRARNISYHNLETFPEKRYGFVDLPKDDAEKLKKKFNGATLKGVKIRIEAARPLSTPAPLGEEVAMAKKKEKADARSDKEERKKRKREAEEVTGIILENDRKVKRGWTTADEPEKKRSKKDNKDKEEKKAKKQGRSKYTDHTECLVKTVLPPNAVDEAKLAKKKKKKGNAREVVIHEFEKTTKFPTFLKNNTLSAAPKPELEYVENKGWVDQAGNVAEVVKSRPPPPVYKIKSKKKAEKQVAKVVEKEESESDSNDSDSSDSGEEPASESENVPASPIAVPSVEKVTPAPKVTLRDLAIKIPPTTPSEPKVVHPLEALFKRPQNVEAVESGPETKGFSFFDGGDDVDKEEDGVKAATGIKVPMTPFTQQDFEMRGIRSAAPTPDTAFPKGGRFKPWEDIDEDIDEDEEDEDDSHKDGSHASVSQSGEAGGEKPTSDFQKWFWENRGDLNRSWRKRRKIASKEKRYRENKARMARAI
ncbi:hypothetical protein QBC43DRAFT_323007 [Cladorrhinum sp. PSN259]|nr:hypothetical protein QBC43DRAFT_323007 [Cladorrhinum sp. PSN259]